MKKILERFKNDETKIRILCKSGHHEATSGIIKEVTKSCVSIDEGEGDVLYIAMDNIAAFKKYK